MDYYKAVHDATDVSLSTTESGVQVNGVALVPMITLNLEMINISKALTCNSDSGKKTFTEYVKRIQNN